jgi:hypothetical protein
MQKVKNPLPEGIAHWAKLLPEYEWTPGPPPVEEPGPNPWVACKTETGNILAGRTGAFRSTGPYMQRIYAKYGEIVSHVILE